MVYLIKQLSAVFVLVTVVGCSTLGYPDKGHGGMAESLQDISLDDYQFSPIMPDEPLGPEHGLRFDWQLAKLQLNALIAEGARWCFPAAVVQALEKQNRIARELEGGLIVDAANDLVIQRRRLNDLEQQLDYVLTQISCSPPNDINSLRSNLETVSDIYELFNIDNQFEVNSAVITPAYMGNLAEAAFILRGQPNLSLLITGHSDITEDPLANNNLANDRAEQVERYLNIFGITKARITKESVDSTLSLYEGTPEAAHFM